jgi:predicted GTPase
MAQAAEGADAARGAHGARGAHEADAAENDGGRKGPARTRRLIIMGAAGRDFHNFNVVFRGRPEDRVVAFTAAQIPDIEGRVYPAALAGPGYPDGIPVHAEAELPRLLQELDVDAVVFSYSDVAHQEVMHRASMALAAGVDFLLLGARSTMLQSRRPVVSVCAVRTGAGKSQTARKVVDILRQMGFDPVVVRHPMPYGDLGEMVVQRFAEYGDLDRHHCTIEEREEYEPHLDRGTVVYAGVDYERILRAAEDKFDVIVWDGGNNDLPFFAPDIHIVVTDPHRAGHELAYHPGEANLRMADVAIINKVDTANPEDVEQVRRNILLCAPDAVIVDAASPVTVDAAGEAGLPAVRDLRGRRALVVEDGPTLTHGEMAYGAGVVAARRVGLSTVDPRPYAVGSVREAFSAYPHIGEVLPAMGYGPRQREELEATINATPADVVLVATPINLGRLVRLNKPALRVRYELQSIGQPTLTAAIDHLAGRLEAKLGRAARREGARRAAQGAAPARATRAAARRPERDDREIFRG